MPARCETCGEEALTDTARFCIGCGAVLPELDPGDVLAALGQPAPPGPPPQAPPAPRVERPAFEPRPEPSRSTPLPPPVSPTQAAAPTRPHRPPPPPRDLPPLRDAPPTVPLSLVVAGVIGLLVLLLILLLVA